jgi:hypothetical protein
MVRELDDGFFFSSPKALFTSPVFSPVKDAGICGDLLFTQHSQIPSNTFPQKYFTMMEIF